MSEKRERYTCLDCGAVIRGGINAYGDDDAHCTDCAAETKPEPAPAIVVTRSGLQTLLPGQEPPPVVKGGNRQQTML